MTRAARPWTDADIREKAVPGRAYSKFGQPGLMLRCGARKRSWQVRFEGKHGYLQRQLGEWPKVGVGQATASTKAMWERYNAGKQVDAPALGQDTIASTWPIFKERLINEGRSPATLAAYTHAFDQLSDEIKARPLSDLSADPRLMEAQVDRIKKALANRKRKGVSAAAQSAVFVSTLFSFARRRDPSLSGDPVSACQTTVPKRNDLAVLGVDEMPAWWTQVKKLKNPIVREALLFTLLSGLRRQSVESLKWSDLDVRRRCIQVAIAKGGHERAFDLILSSPMIRCLWRARQAGRLLFRENAREWVFPGERGHLRGSSLRKYGVHANHALRRAYATAATLAGVDEPTVGRLLNHGGRSVTSRYIRDSHLGKMLAAAQSDISTFIVKSLGNPPNIG